MRTLQQLLNEDKERTAQQVLFWSKERKTSNDICDHYNDFYHINVIESAAALYAKGWRDAEYVTQWSSGTTLWRTKDGREILVQRVFNHGLVSGLEWVVDARELTGGSNDNV